MVNEKAVEEIDVLVLDYRQVEVLVDVGLSSTDHLQCPLALLFKVLHDVR
jgi:hypothetical protein